MSFCTVSCLVTDAEGTPIEGAKILVEPTDKEMTITGSAIGKLQVEKTTDEYGEAEFDIPLQDSITSTTKTFELFVRDPTDQRNIISKRVYSPNTATATLDELLNQAEEVAT